MKRTILNNWLMAVLMAGISLGVTSCKDDDNKEETVEPSSTVSVDQSIVSHGLETDMKSAVVQLPVTSNGLWTVTLKKGTDWLQIKDWQVTYNGSQNLELLFDENRTGYDRTTTLNLGNSEGEVQTITVRQTYTYEGMPPTNGSGLAFADKGVGCGMDYDYALNVKLAPEANAKFEPTKVKKNNNIFNIAKIERLQSEGKLQHSAYTEATIPFSELQAHMTDSSLVQSKDLKASLKVTVTLGEIRFSAQGSYHARKEEKYSYVDYVITRLAPMYNVVVSPAEVTTYATEHREMAKDRDSQLEKEVDELIERYKKENERRHRKNLNEDGLTETQQIEIDNMYDAIPLNYDYAGVFSANFTRRYNELYNAIVQTQRRNKPIDKAAADAALNALDNDYGPFFISGGDFGGIITVHAKVKNSHLEGADTIGGNLEAGMEGLFNVTGEFKYSSVGYNTFHDSDTNFFVHGGNANDTSDALWKLTLSGDETIVRDKWQGVLKDWVASMYTKGDHSSPLMSEAAASAFIITPIWTLFYDSQMQLYAQNYFTEKYTNRGIKTYLGIANGTIKPKMQDLLNPNSKIWDQK